MHLYNPPTYLNTLQQNAFEIPSSIANKSSWNLNPASLMTIWTSGGHLLWIYCQLIAMSYISHRPKYIAIYWIHSAGLQHIIAMHCWIIFDATAEKATIYKCTNFQHHLSLLLSAASTHTTKQYPATNPQPTSALTTWLRKAFWSRRDISAIYWDRIDKYIFLKFIGNISALAALARQVNLFKGCQHYSLSDPDILDPTYMVPFLNSNFYS